MIQNIVYSVLSFIQPQQPYNVQTELELLLQREDTIEIGIESPLDSISVGGMTFKNVDDVLADGHTARHLPQEDLVDYLTKRANQDEFQVAYLPEQGILVNLTKESEIDWSVHDTDLFDALITSGISFTYLHNHSKIGISSENISKNPLFWIVPSVKDIYQYLGITKRGADFTYGIISEHGLLTIRTSLETAENAYNPFYIKIFKDAVNHMQMSVRGKAVEDLTQWADDYRGVFGLSFQAAGK